MSISLNILSGMDEAVRQLNESASAKKCWGCGCLHSSLTAIEQAISVQTRPPELQTAILANRARLTDVKYDCLGCEVCYPPLAMNALNIEGEACPSEEVEERTGWPPLPGDYTALRYHASVAICTLTDSTLSQKLVERGGEDVSVVGTMYTENLGIERVVKNIIANPNIRFLVLCGSDSKQAIGHLPGQSMLALANNGIDERGRIIGARGKRPVLRNVGVDAIAHFREVVDVVDMIDTATDDAVIAMAKSLATRSDGPAPLFASQAHVQTIQGFVPERMTSDPAGYFVVYVDRARRLLSLEHYANTGVLSTIVEGRFAAELYFPVIERKLITRLDHAAYLGRELAKAERSLATGEPYVQDAAPERIRRSASASSCGCGPSCSPNGGHNE